MTIDKACRPGYGSSVRACSSREIDMTGAKKVAGEVVGKRDNEARHQITGDIVSEWVAKTHEIFGGPRKTIVFCSGVAHGEDLARKFGEAGYPTSFLISYKGR